LLSLIYKINFFPNQNTIPQSDLEVVIVSVILRLWACEDLGYNLSKLLGVPARQQAPLSLQLVLHGRWHPPSFPMGFLLRGSRRDGFSCFQKFTNSMGAPAA
jgi:hypothetical protein